MHVWLHISVQLYLCRLQHALKLSEGQLRNMFLLRQAFLQKQAAIQCWEQELQLAAAPSDTDARLHAITAARSAQQMQETSRQLQEVCVQYVGVMMDGVSCIFKN